MNTDPAVMIMDLLLDKYERSTFFRDGRIPTRRFLLKFHDKGATEFPLYDIEDSDSRITINQAVKGLANDGLVGFDWMRGETEHILARVWLKSEAIPKAYQAAGRRPKEDLVEDVKEELENLKEGLSLEWALAWCEDMLLRITETKRIPALLPGEPKERELLFKALSGLEKEAGQAATARIFSVKYLGDSKAFEKTVRPRLLSILRQYLEGDDDTRDEELLLSIGIVRYPEQFEFRGNVRFESKAGRVDFRALHNGASLSSADLPLGTLHIDPKVTAILSIENRANYFAALTSHNDPNEVILYHGGQYGPARKGFFQAIQKAMPKDSTWHHWGDLDFGGFSMLARLRREIDPTIEPYRMDQKEVTAYRDHCSKVSKTYADKLLELSCKPELFDSQDVLRYLAENQIRLEQEALLLE